MKIWQFENGNAKDEWQKVSKLFAGEAEDSIEARKKAYQILLYTGSSPFNAVLGCGRTPDSEYRRLEAHGFYWTATENDSSMAWFSNFAKGSQALYLKMTAKKQALFPFVA